MSERTTPETDKYANADWWTLFRATEHSRILERERDEAREESLEQARLLGISGERECGLIAERDEAKRKYDIEATEHMLNINEICNQRDAAMDALGDISFYPSSGIGDDNTTVQEYKDRILDGIKHIKQERDEARDTIMKIDEIFIDSEDMHDDWMKVGNIARTFCEKYI